MIVEHQGRASSETVLAGSSSFAAARDAFDRAARQAPDRVSTLAFTLAGRVVHLHIAGRLLADILRSAFAHLLLDPGGHACNDADADGSIGANPYAGAGRDSSSQPASSPALTIRVWDAADTGVDSPDAAHGDPGRNGVVLVSDDTRVVAHRRRTSTVWLDRQRHEIVGCFSDARHASLYDRGKPLQVPLAIWHIDRGAPLVHAGVVARSGRGVLFPGKGGSGKTTASLSCALAGFDFLGDDCIGLERLDPAIRVHSVYASANVEPHHLQHFPTLKPHGIPGVSSDEDKDLVLLHTRLPKPLARTTTLAAIAIPRIVDAPDTQLRPASRGEALRALAPSTLLFFPGAQAANLAFLASVVASVPCYWLEMGPDLAQIPARLEALLHV